MRYFIALLIWIAEIVGGIVALGLVCYLPFKYGCWIDGSIPGSLTGYIGLWILGMGVTLWWTVVVAFVICIIGIIITEIIKSKPINKLFRLAKFNLRKADQLSPHFNKTLETVKREMEEIENN